ncbi:hypothetical protein QUB63_18955 [Microcoleus sp. ARI1-B5]
MHKLFDNASGALLGKDIASVLRSLSQIATNQISHFFLLLTAVKE